MSTANLQAVLNAIDDINREDPNIVISAEGAIAKELRYGHQMSDCLAQYWPDADECLQIAVRAQHIKRWHIKRSDYPQGKTGYLNWRKALAQFHAELTESLMLQHGYSSEQAKRTGEIIRKTQLKRNSDSQTLEDVACLVFLQHYFADFASKHDEEKIIDILQKTWRKMSDNGHKIALTLSLPPHLAALLNKALTPDS